MGWAQNQQDDEHSDGVDEVFSQDLVGFDFRRRQMFAQEHQDPDDQSGRKADENLNEEIRLCEAALEDEVKRMRGGHRVLPSGSITGSRQSTPLFW